MNCPNCGNKVLRKRDHCETCGKDIRIDRKIISASNLFYNRALKKAKVRDLTGAILDLQQSLKLYKKNKSARNLLGLIYYETGEVVAALSEWVLSKHFSKDENEADEYVNKLQANPTKLDTINQAIKKYNSALLSAKQGSDDLAIIQLKKVLQLNPHFLRAYHLLTLLYLNSEQKEKAQAVLQSALSIDKNNTITLSYLKEVEELQDSVSHNIFKKEFQTGDSSSSFFSVDKEERFSFFGFLNLLIGILIGIAVVAFLFIPSVKKQAIEKYTANQEQKQQVAEQQTVTISKLEQKNKNLQKELTDLQQKLEDDGVGEEEATQYDYLCKAVQFYLNQDDVQAAQALLSVDEEKIKAESAQQLYSDIKENTFQSTSAKLYQTGHRKYSNGEYEEAKKELEQAFQMDAQNVDALYFLARAYDRLGDDKKAKEYYQKVIEEFPNSTRAQEAKGMLQK